MALRVPRMTATGLADVGALLENLGDRVTVIFDIDGTVVPQGAPPNEYAQAVRSAIDVLENHPSVERAIPLTNGPDRGIPEIVSGANKPWTTKRRLGTSPSEKIVVIGDQVLTDGLLAWRLGAVFFHLVLDEESEPPDQARLRRRGRLLARLLFKPPSRA